MKNLLVLLTTLIFFGCNPFNGEKDLESITVKDWRSDPFILIRTEYNDSIEEQKIILQKFVNGEEVKDFDRTFTLNPIDGYYFQTEGLIQCDKNSNLVYLTCFNGNMHDGEFNWFKIFEYSFITKSFREIANFDWFIGYWYFCELNNCLYYYDKSNSLISLNTETQVIDTLLQSELDFTNFTPTIIDGKTLQFIVFNDITGIHKLSIDINTNYLKREYLFYAEDMADYRNGKAIEMDINYRSKIEEIRIRDKNGVKKIKYDIKNIRSFWLTDNEFVIIDENKLIKLNSDLEIVEEKELEDVYISFCLKNCLLISYTENNEKKIGLLSFDFQELQELKEIKGLESYQLVDAINN